MATVNQIAAARTPQPIKYNAKTASTAAPVPAATPATAAGLQDTRIAAPPSPLEKNFDVPTAARLIMAKFGNHAAMGLIIQARGGDHQEFTPQQQDDAMYGIRDALGLRQTSQHPSAIELRDMDHFTNMSGPIQDDFPIKPGDSPWKATVQELGREALGVKCATMAIGYSAAKAIAQNTPIMHGSTYLNGPSTSRATFHEVKVGLQGVWDGVAGH